MEYSKLLNAEMQLLVNGILYTDWDRCYDKGYEPEEYLKMFCLQTGVVRETYTALLWSGDLCGEEVKAYSKNLNEMYSFWYSLYDVMDEGHIKADYNDLDLWYPCGQSLVQISDLTATDNGQGQSGFTYKINLQLADGTEDICKTMTINSDVAWNPNQTRSEFDLEKMRKIQKEMSELWKDVAVDAAIDILGKYNSTAGDVLEAIKNQSGGLKLSDLVSDTTGLLGLEEALGKNGEAGVVILSSIFEYAEKMKELQDDLSEVENESMLSWFSSANIYSVLGDDTVYIGDGMYNYNIIQGVHEWNEHGLGSWITNDEAHSELTQKELEELYYMREEQICDNIKELFEPIPEGDLNKVGLTTEEKNALLFMIFGENTEKAIEELSIPHEYSGTYESVLDIDQEVFLNMTGEIKKGLKKGLTDYEGEALLQMWQNAMTEN